ncbi:MAG TPA: LppX_LprAFG lipoprotein [Anaerolineae bacterium]|nr:LppX_LprAFG lipoprotein [Anaerolineae bacterium]
MRLILRFGILACCFAALSACGPPPPPELPPDEIVQRAAKGMASQNTLRFTIDIAGTPAMLNPALGLALRSGEGVFARPDRMGVHLKLVGPVAIEADMIALGDEQYITNFLSKEWEPLPAEIGFNPAVMFHPEFGLEKTLEGGLDDAELVGVESIDGAQAYYVKGRIEGSRLWRMSGGLIGSSTVDVEVWVDPQTFAVRKIVLVDPTIDPGNPSIWTMTFSKFGEPVTIEAPDV